MNNDDYFAMLEDQVKVCYSVAEEARTKGLDPLDKVEIPLARSLAEKVVGLISVVYPQVNDERITNRILELEKEFGALDYGVAFRIAEEIAKEKFCKFENPLQAMEAGIRLGFAYFTLGVVSSPIEGFTELKIGKTRDGKEYFVPYFSGPIRSAGTTASCMALILIDYIRETFGYAKYDPDEKEIKRTVTELYDYHERVNNLQYLPTEEEATFLAQNLPIQINGEASEQKEVFNFKDLPRIGTNNIRGGMCLIFGEGLAQKAQKAQRLLKRLQANGFVISDWKFLEDYILLHKKREKGTTDTSPTYIKDLVAGRPVFGHPSRSGGFRLRYGRSRVSGFSATSVHPATMGMSNEFLSTGTQLKVEKPTKGCIVTSCDSLEGPIVKLINGSVKKVKTLENARRLYHNVSEIIYFGDILFSFGDLANRNYELMKVGYVEEWWELELKKILAGMDDRKGIELQKINKLKISFDSAIEISDKTGVSLHPEYIFFWSQISRDELLEIFYYLSNGIISEGKLVLPYRESEREKFAKAKRALELLGIEHEVTLEHVVLEDIIAKSLFVNLGLSLDLFKENNYKIFNEVSEIIKKTETEEFKPKNSLGIIQEISKYKIKDRAGTFIGSRMGRPEKAKLRKLIGSPNVLFPVGSEGGRFRSVNEADKFGTVKAEFPTNFCENCKKDTIYYKCEDCNQPTKPMHYCKECKSKFDTAICPEHKIGQRYCSQRVDMNHYFRKSFERIGLEKPEVPVLIKGVKGTINENHIPEHLAKGILRARRGLAVNKDGTIRYDGTEAPLTHFKPREIGTSFERLKQLGYENDCYGKPLENDEQILELKPHDILIPACPDTLDEKGDDVFIKICNFIDDMLVRFYKMKPFYNVKKREDLVGHLSVCISPHNCACVTSRIIGFTKAQVIFASPYMHAACRRDCFDYNTYLPIKIGEEWRIVKIGDIVEKLNPQKIVDNFGTREIEVKDYYTLGTEKEVNINNFTKHTPIKMLEIKTLLGRTLKVTENHKFLISNHKVRASELVVGNKLLISLKTEIKERDRTYLDFFEIFKDNSEVMVRDINKLLNSKGINLTEKEIRNYKHRDSYPIKFIENLIHEKILNKKEISSCKIGFIRDRINFPMLVPLSNELLEFFGLYIAEGYSRRVTGKKGLNQVYVSSSEKDRRDFIERVIFSHFGLKKSEKREDAVNFSSRIFYELVINYFGCGHNAYEKRIPSLFLNLPLKKLACVLRGYFEGDGSAERDNIKVSCDSVSKGLLADLEFCLSRFGIPIKKYEYEKELGPQVRAFYIRKERKVPKFKITKLTILHKFTKTFVDEINFLSDRKKARTSSYKLKYKNMRKGNYDFDENFVYDEIVSIKDIGEKESYCLNVEKNLVRPNGILTAQCDGDEFAVMMLLDTLINFSRQFLPSHRGGTQDAPLVLNARIRAGEVDDQILDLENCFSYPLEMYELAEQGGHKADEIKLDNVKSRLAKGIDPFFGTGFTHDTFDFNNSVTNSSYKTIPNMAEKVKAQMDLVDKLRAVDSSDVARLIIDRHFMRDLRGNLRKFFEQEFRCVACNMKFRRPPMAGKCTVCDGKIIFTISYGSIVKYLEQALFLSEKYNVPPYIKQNLYLTKLYIESVFGKDTEKQKTLF